MASLLAQGVRRLEAFGDREGVGDVIDRASQDAARAQQADALSLEEVDPPVLWLVLEGRDEAAPPGAIRVPVPRA